MTILTARMRHYVETAYDNANWLVRTFWRIRVNHMSDEQIMKTYYMLTD